MIEKGLESAITCTNALFNSTPESLGQLTSEEVMEVFKSATIANVNYQPGLSILELAMMVKCFKSISMFVLKVTSQLRLSWVRWS